MAKVLKMEHSCFEIALNGAKREKGRKKVTIVLCLEFLNKHLRVGGRGSICK